MEARNPKRQRQKELKQKYLEMKPPMGAYIIKNNMNERALMNVSKDIKSTFNSHEFQLKMESHMVKEMQRDWKKYGEEAFSFEVLQYLEYDEKGEKTDYTEELEIMKIIWLEKLNEDESTELYKR